MTWTIAASRDRRTVSCVVPEPAVGRTVPTIPRRYARMVDENVVVVGAGPAGLAAAWAIRQAGIDPLVVEQADAVAGVLAPTP